MDLAILERPSQRDATANGDRGDSQHLKIK